MLKKSLCIGVGLWACSVHALQIVSHCQRLQVGPLRGDV
jgi:hypothetical protein